ncbi:hypothetical protein W59_12831 [Rhodococcus opacus RKJ300 = JCM 13270]|jgi:hypothetical protein|uniref:Uncharacterized protein n=2 Tax=Nocardiaceae TaxID=85025 RepID=I0WT37_RHOOP|nr:hypothetical protein W59_12831 [Rhodococcus opacus RKJ300 = JCM 13270]QQZ19152.1 hypothetical protein GO592_37475 [Rhodococcus sp. 21391]
MRGVCGQVRRATSKSGAAADRYGAAFRFRGFNSELAEPPDLDSPVLARGRSPVPQTRRRAAGFLSLRTVLGEFVMWFPATAFSFDLNRPTPAPPALSPPAGVGILGTLVAALRTSGRPPAATERPRPGTGTTGP